MQRYTEPQEYQRLLLYHLKMQMPPQKVASFLSTDQPPLRGQKPTFTPFSENLGLRAKKKRPDPFVPLWSGYFKKDIIYSSIGLMIGF
jgi:hypothetical protein